MNIDKILQYEPCFFTSVLPVDKSRYEPNLEAIILHYYTSHGIGLKDSKDLVEKYKLHLKNHFKKAQ